MKMTAVYRGLIIICALAALAGVAWAQAQSATGWGAADEWGNRLMMLVAIVAIISGAALAWANLNNRVNNNAGELEEHEDRLKALENKLLERLDSILDILKQR